jgi:tetratricopeptide (TPR) repeat protein
MKLFLRFVFVYLILIAALHLLLPFESGLAAITTESNENLAFQKREEAYRANNLGVAHLEQFNYREGVAEFRRALSLDPTLRIAQINLAIALFNAQDIQAALETAKTASEIAPDKIQPVYILGLIAREQNRTDDAIALFQRVLAADPADVGANVNLGQIYIQQRNFREAEVVLRRAIEAEPYNATAMYNLATVLLRSGARGEGQQQMTRFQALRQSGAATSIGQNYLEQGRYAEAIASTGLETELVDKTPPKVTFQNLNIGLPVSGSPTGTQKYALSKPFALLPRGGATLFDFDNDGDLDLAQITAAAASQISLYRNQNGKFTDVTRGAGDLNKLPELQASGIVAGDFDNDNFADLLIFGTGQAALFRNTGKNGFQNVTSAAKIPSTSINSISGAFVDADHDGDLDIFLGGFGERNNKADKAAANQLWRNNGDGTFTDVSEIAKINSPSRAVAVVPSDYDNRRDVDLLVLNYGAKPALFRNLRDGTFKDVASEVGLNQIGNWTCTAAGDFNKDSFVDFFFGKSDGAGVLAISDGRGKFAVKDAPTGTEKAHSAQFLDYDNDGLLDLIVNTEKGFAVSRNLGDSLSTADPSAFKIKSAANDALTGSRQILSGDIDGDGDVDLFSFARDGSLQFVSNLGKSANNSRVIRLQGRVSNRTGIGAKIDLRVGSLTQKLETYSASPAPAPSDVHFGLGKREKPDAVRVVWTSGVVQAEIDFPSNQTTANHQPLKIEELDRKPSSCPYLYAWNGERFEFITDFLGGGEMGNWKQAGAYHYPDSDEFVRIAPDKLKPKNGRYEIRVTNELEEVLFLDHLKLIAVEHDANAEVYPNEGLGIQTTGKRILYTTQNEYAPLSAVDAGGRDVSAKIKRLDRKFYDSFKSLNIRGYAAPHSLTLKLDDKKNYRGRTLLLLTGWTDYAFSSDNLAAAQSGKSLFLPKLQVKNKKGEWQTAIESIGISVGRPQTVIVDLTGKFPTDSREVRIVTNFKTYWDKIAVDTSEQAEVKTTELSPVRADLRERGFSEEIKYGEMIAANYDRVVRDGRWKYFNGNFTRPGDVKPLLEQTDDVFVISKTGDEIVLSFPALPDLPQGRKRTFLLYADGYSKEMDINSGSPDSVLPLPFKQMKKYPYDADEQFPMTEEKRRIYEEYTTRTVKKALPRIEASLFK